MSGPRRRPLGRRRHPAALPIPSSLGGICGSRRREGAFAAISLLGMAVALGLFAPASLVRAATLATPVPAAALAPPAGQPAVPPAPVRWVTDPTGFLSPGVRQELDARLEQVQARTGHQVLVWIGSTLGGEAIEDFAVRAFGAWRVGRKGIDDGLVIFLFPADRKVRFEVGYGLEGQLPDVIASRIIRDVMTPRLRAGDHDGAVVHGVEATLAILDGQPWSRAIDAQAAGTDLTAGAPGAAAPEAPGEPGAYAPRASPGAGRPQVHHGLLYSVVKGILIVAVLLFLITHPSIALWLLLSFSGGGRGGGGWSGGGGGGFSGGGGRSGGGGASGSW
jgi:uncharacterized protein